MRFLATVLPLTFLYPDLSMACIYTYGWLVFFSFVVCMRVCVLFLLLYFTYLFSRLIEDFELVYKKKTFSLKNHNNYSCDKY